MARKIFPTGPCSVFVIYPYSLYVYTLTRPHPQLVCSALMSLFMCMHVCVGGGMHVCVYTPINIPHRVWKSGAIRLTFLPSDSRDKANSRIWISTAAVHLPRGVLC